jgi:hypothetical protein
MLQQLQRAIVRSEKNKVDQKFADFVKDNKLFEIDKEHSRTELDKDGKVKKVRDALRDREDFHYKVNGEAHRIDIASEDPLLDRAMRNLSATETNDVVAHLGKLTRRFSQLVTSWTPSFVFTNFTRDIQAAMANVTAEHGGNVAKDILTGVPKAMKEMYQANRDPAAMSQMVREFKQDGGQIGWYAVKGAPELEKELVSRIGSAGPGSLPAAKRAFAGIKDWVQDTNASVENGTRFATYAALRKAGASRAKAAHAARNVTLDFSKKGEAGPTMNALYAFFNANVQGAKRFKEVVIDNPRGRAVAGGIVAAGMAMDAYNRANAGDSDGDGTNDYDDIPEYVKQKNFVLMRGEGKTPLLFPMPYGFNILHTLGRQMMSGMSGSTTPGKAAMSLVGSAWNAFNPLGGEADLTQWLSPTILDPFVQHATNRTWTGRPLEPEGYPGAAKKPESEMYFKNVSPTAKALAEWLNTHTGGDKVTPGFISWSPEVIAHYADAANSYLTGGLGKFAVQAGETGKALAEGETPELRNVPVANRFLYQRSPGQTGQKYRANLEELDTLNMRYQAYRKEGNREGISDLPLPLLRIRHDVEHIDRLIRGLRKLGPAARPDMEQRIEALQNRANAMISRAKAAAEEGA